MIFALLLALLLVFAVFFAAYPLIRQKHFIPAAVATVFVIAGAAGLYAVVGSWQLGVQPEQAALPSVDEMVNRLVERLEDDPDNLQGWVMLGRSYVVIGNYAEAVGAYENALRIAGEGDPDILVNYAEAVVLDDPNALQASAKPLFARALELDPENPKGLWYGGLAAAGSGDTALAAKHWRKLLEQNPPEPFLNIVKEQLALIGVDVETAAPAAGKTASIDVQVEMQQTLRDKLNPQNALFVYVKDASGGPPLAARRLMVSEFPVTLTISENDAMMADVRFSRHKRLIIGARISTSGTAMPGPGDLQGETPYAAEQNPAVVVIDTELQ
ncbi:MAG: tetratricopeptide repeat protein [Gammaproteobacteria bacterium]|nr:tetratricopeptide repeat protein [Gammaproteobacteria bacterium]